MATVSLFLANGFEEIEGLTVVDLLRRAEIDIEMVSIEEGLTITGGHGIVVVADKLFAEVDFEGVDMLVLPGGMPGTTNLLKHQELVFLLKQFHEKGKMLSAICAAPSVLGAHGILQGKNATSYPGWEKKLLGANYQEAAVVHDGNVITSRGLGTAIDFALEIISYFKGKEKADQIKSSIIY